MQKITLHSVASRIIIVCALLVLLCAPVLAADSTPVPPSKLIVDTTENVKMLMKTQKHLPAEELNKKLEEAILPIFDFSEMAQRCLGKNWHSATPAEQQKFVDLFSKLLSRTYLKRIKRNAESSSTHVSKEVVQNNSAVLRTILTYSDETAKVDYRLHLKVSHWKIYDVIIENIGLVTNYRNEFASIVRKDKMSGLLTKLEEKVNSPEAELDSSAADQ